MPALMDSFFYHSVVYLFEHNEKGAMGLIINHPTHIMLSELLDYLALKTINDTSKVTPVLFGGPVQKGQGMVLHNSTENWQATTALTKDLFLTTSIDILAEIGNPKGPDKSLVTLGYAGWSADKLEQEIAENSWLTVNADPEVIFNTPVENRWEAAAKLLGIDIHLMPNISGHA